MSDFYQENMPPLNDWKLLLLIGLVLAVFFGVLWWNGWGMFNNN